MTPQAGFWRRRLLAPILDQLRQGTSPREVTLALALGAVLSIFPILGATTALCALAGLWLRLNQPLIQAVNYLLYPLQLLLLIPFYRAGERLFGAEPVPIVSIGELVARFQDGPGQFLVDYGLVGLYGIAVWTLLAPLVFLILRAAIHPLVRRLQRPSIT